MSVRDINQKQFKEDSKSQQQSIKLLTFNTWGLKFISKFRKERLKAIADSLAKPATEDDDYDIVALQEIWCEEDWNYLDSVCRSRYPYRRIFKSGIISGPGLAVLSKIPVSETFLYRFPINGRPSAFFRGDFYVGKSIAVTMFQPHHLDIKPIALLNSHMHAPYGPGDASYSTHRACQAWDFAKLVRMLKKAGYAVIQVGDLNSTPDSLPYKLFTVEGGLTDSWNVLNKDRVVPNDEIAKLSLEDQILLAGVTCNSRLNTWREKRPLWEACRLDYALIDPSNITPIDAKVKFVEKLPAPFSCSYSDHFAYSVDLAISSKNDKNHVEESTVEEKEAIYRELLAEISQYRKFTIPLQLFWRKLHFVVSFMVVVGMHIAIVFVVDAAAWVSVVFLLVTTLIAVTGGLNGLIWFMGVRAESRSLQEVQMEVEDAYNYLIKQNS
ncbi:ISC1 Inositol phosphosphingolipids phospholipase C [Candida maltosa Xu316]|uniref:Endonuclease/exonuclease/phosphatase domain-containing protein n=1 Tax=Candida maltosa (strain Xu316) TaxID=1245528 RepID=M3HMT6_CANMX|nr:hypothetical protein G210_0614 [Candida maltosa Xu316]